MDISYRPLFGYFLLNKDRVLSWGTGAAPYPPFQKILNGGIIGGMSWYIFLAGHDATEKCRCLPFATHQRQQM
jgi:hypothetical protein